jgi:glutamate racemase
MKSKRGNAIGVFDSGVGGLTVVRALMEGLPFEDIIYFGDTARVPYGVKSVETIRRYALQITEFLLQQEVKALIVACNTMSAVAYGVIEDLAPVPLLGVVDAGARGAVALTKTRRIGVIGTPTTITSSTYVTAIKRYDPHVEIFSQACPLFVPLAEEGWLDHAVTRLTAQEYLRPLIANHIDTLVLGCTHYPLLKPVLQEVLGSTIQLVDSAQAITDQAHGLLDDYNLLQQEPRSPEYRFYVTDLPLRFTEIGERFLGRELTNVKVLRW